MIPKITQTIAKISYELWRGGVFKKAFHKDPPLK